MSLAGRGLQEFPRAFVLHTRRILSLLLLVLVNNNLAFRVLGGLNARLGVIDRVFLVYPSRPEFALAYAYPWLLDRFRWRPVLVGAYRQGGHWGVTLAVAGSERELCDESNGAQLEDLIGEVERIRGLLAAPRRALAGVLPGVLYARGLSKQTGEAEAAVECVLEAIQHVRRLEEIDEGGPIILLGARGFVGSRVMRRLNGQRVIGVDLANGAEHEWPHELSAERAILVDVTRAGSLDDYVDKLWPGLIILNEVYPPPPRAKVELIRERGVRMYHLAGVEAWAFPSFPGPYAGGVPCCAAKASQELSVRVLRLS